nr:N-acetyllactosaminide beta-1,6-N-acetylglucosaminyl-transferase-like [Lytechinus pictus]
MIVARKARRVSSRLSLSLSWPSWASMLWTAMAIIVLFVIQYQVYRKYHTANNSEKEISGKNSINGSIFGPNKSYVYDALRTEKVDAQQPNSSNLQVKAKKLFDEGKWNSSFVSSYHKHYPVDCTAIIRGEHQSITKATEMLKINGRKIPTDVEVKNWTSDCEHYRSERRYPVFPRSKEEAEFPIAYIIVTHSESSQLERLLRAVYQPQNVYCLHPDAKSPSLFQESVRSLAECLPNVFIASKTVKVNYAHSSRLQADINCMSDLLQRPEPWNYVLNLCAQDFPLKTNLEMVHQLKAFQGYNDIPGILAPDWFDHRTRIHHEFRNNMMIKMKDVPKPPPPQDFRFFFGNAYYAATKEFVHFVIHNQTAIDLLKYSEDTFSPDEHYWVTLHRIPGVPGGYTKSSWNSTVRFIHWKSTSHSPECVGKYVRNICIFGAGYVQHLAHARHLFANKFQMSFDPIALQCMEQLLDYRNANPEAIKDYVPEFPATHMFGLN